MSEQNTFTQGRRRRKLLWSGGIALVAVIAFLLFRSSNPAEGISSHLPTYQVQQGPLLISVMESGTIKAREQEVIKSEVEGTTTILYLIEEGQVVEEGELLVELDASRLNDSLVEQRILVQNREASFINARENFEVTKSQAESDVTRAQLDVEFAEEDLRKYLDGDFPMTLKESEARITLTKSELQRAEEKLRGSERLLERDFITQTEFEGDKNAAQKARLDLELAEGNLALLREFTYERQLKELQSRAEEARRALERARLKANADVVQSEASLRAAEAEWNQQKDKLAKVQQQIEKTKMHAPTSGLVVYATTGQGGGFRGNQEPLAEGQSVRERQEIIHLPTTASMMAEVKLPESSLSKVRTGMPVRVTVDALPGRVFTGRVNRIAPLPDAQSAWLNPDLKVYNTEVMLDGEVEGVRTGMGCRVEILIERYDNATYIPVQAVMRVKGKPTVYAMANGVVQPREVEIGLDNNRMINILSGLNPGEEVLLTPPLSEGATSDNDEDGESIETSVRNLLPTADGAATRARGIVPVNGAVAPAAEGEGRRGPRGAEGGAARGGEGGATRGEGGGGRMGGMTPEQRERFESMSEEEREQMRQQFRQQRSTEGGAEGGSPRGEGGARGEGRPRGEGGGGNFGNMTPEQMQEMRQRFENASEEEREQMRQQFMQQRPRGGAEGGGAANAS